jgi:drug/metabolite transporter (DMT)-like permease
LTASLVPYLVPLLCAVLYPLGTLLMKRALEKGADIPSTLLANFWAMALVFAFVFPFGTRPIPWDLWWQPLLIGLTSFAGQGCAIFAIVSGDLTVATPALGSKVLLVALLTELWLGLAVPLPWWIAASLSFAAVFFLQAGAPHLRRGVWRALSFSLGAAAFFAIGDVLIQKWAPRWGAFHFLPPVALATAVYSLALVPRLKAPPWRLPSGGFAWLAGGSLVLGLQSLLLTAVIGTYGQVTLVNILFSSRGLWNFALIWFLGHWFRNSERAMGAGVMGRRLIGAALMFAAIVLVSIWR